MKRGEEVPVEVTRMMAKEVAVEEYNCTSN